MSFLKLHIVEDYSALSARREIYLDYQCNCEKFWRDEDRLIVFQANGHGVTRILDHLYSGDTAQTARQVLKLASHEITDKIIVAGAHTVVNLKDRFYLSEEVIKSAEIGLNLIAGLQTDYGKKADFLMPLNDFYMEKDAGTDEGRENAYRKEALDPYITPFSLNQLLIDYSKKLNRTIDAYYCSEKNMADRFKRHIKNKKKDDDNSMFEKSSNNWDMIVGQDRFAVLTNDKPNCAAGNAATLRAIRYDVDSNKRKDNYTSHIGVYPLCSMDNVLNGYKAAQAFYGIDMPTYFVFCGKSCFDHAKSAAYRPQSDASKPQAPSKDAHP